MGIWTLSGELDGSERAAVMIDSVTMRPFGFVFRGRDAAEDIDDFLAYAHGKDVDVRAANPAYLEELHDGWLAMRARNSERCEVESADTDPAQPISTSEEA